MKTILDYLKIAYDNWDDWAALEYATEVYWSGWDYMVWYNDWEKKWANALNSIICRKEFIEAIARWIWQHKPYWTSKRTRIKCMFQNQQLLYDEIEELIDDITVFQAIAIRDNKLEEFINNLIKE